MKDYKPPTEVRGYMKEYGGKIRNWTALELYDDAKFMIGDGGWRKGLSLGKTILLDKDSEDMAIVNLSARIYHELVHAAQWKEYGTFGFIGTYFGQWIRSGFSYERMKDKGLEKEAIEKEKAFKDRILGYT